MSFVTSTETFQNIFMTAEPDEDLTKDFFDAVLKYLAKRRSIVEADLLYKWIKEGNPMHGFIAGPDVVREIADNMIASKVPFLCVTEKYGEVGFLIRAYDGRTADDIKKSVLNKKAKYCKVVTSEQLKKDVVRSRESDKNIIHVNYMTPEQIEILRKLCEENLDDTEVGIDEMQDGTYMFSFYGKFGVSGRGPVLSSVNQLFCLLFLMSDGFRGQINQRIARNRRHFNIALANGFKPKGGNLRTTPAWIVGQGPHYLMLNGSGFEYGVAVPGNGTVTLEEQYSVDSASPEYQAELSSYLARIEDSTVTYNQSQAVQHLETQIPGHRKGIESGLDFSLSKDDKIIQRTERNIVAKVNELVSAKIETNPIMTMEGKWDQKFKLYLKESAGLIDGARLLMNYVTTKAVQAAKSQNIPIDDKHRTELQNLKNQIYQLAIVEKGIEAKDIPEGYKLEDYQKIIEIPRSCGLELEAYLPAMNAMRHIEATMVQARLPQIKDVNEKIRSMSDKKGKEKEQERDYFSTRNHPGKDR